MYIVIFKKSQAWANSDGTDGGNNGVNTECGKKSSRVVTFTIIVNFQQLTDV